MGILSQLAGQQDEATQAGQSIGAKTKMINEYKASITPKGVTPKSAPKPVSSSADRVNKTPSSQQYGSRPGEKRLKLGKDGEVLGSYKKGGKVKRTGVYKLHKTERVLTARQTAKFEKKGGLSALAGK